MFFIDWALRQGLNKQHRECIVISAKNLIYMKPKIVQLKHPTILLQKNRKDRKQSHHRDLIVNFVEVDRVKYIFK